MAASLIATPIVHGLRAYYGLDWSGAFCILITAAICTVGWGLATWLTAPSRPEKLDAFYRRVRPHGHWGPVARRCSDVTTHPIGLGTVVAWLSGTVALCAAMFTLGKIVLGEFTQGAVLLVVCVFCAWLAYRLSVPRRARLPLAAAPVAGGDPPL